MQKKMKALLQTICFLFIKFSYAAKYKSCELHIVQQICPNNAACQELSGNAGGGCICDKGFVFNDKYKNLTEYCIQSPISILNSSTMSNVVPGSSLSESKTIVNIQPPASSHHIILGILISMFMALLFIGVAWGIKRLHPVRRLREYVITKRRNRPLYEDVMINQDIDDPSLT